MATVLLPLTQGKHALIDAEDAPRVMAHKWRAIERTNTWYAISSICQNNVYLHRFILNAPTGITVDHENHDGLDCQRHNLRLATHVQNSQNSRMKSRNTSGFKGVSWDKRWRKWAAYIRYDGHNYNLGGYATVEEAARVYDRAALAHFGEFAVLNFPLKEVA